MHFTIPEMIQGYNYNMNVLIHNNALYHSRGSQMLASSITFRFKCYIQLTLSNALESVVTLV